MSYWADSAFLAAAGIPTVLYGAAGEGAHADTEWVSRSGTSTATTVLTQFAQDFCSKLSNIGIMRAVARPRPTPIVAHQIDLFCMAQLIGRERSAAAPTADTCAPHIGSAATVRDGPAEPFMNGDPGESQAVGERVGHQQETVEPEVERVGARICLRLAVTGGSASEVPSLRSPVNSAASTAAPRIGPVGDFTQPS